MTNLAKLAFKRLLKTTAFKLGNVLTVLLSRKKVIERSHEAIIIWMPDSLGVGDHLMLLRHIHRVSAAFSASRLIVISRWPELFITDRVEWKKKADIPKDLWNKSLLICPDYSVSNYKLWLRAKDSVGFLFSNRIYSNFAGHGPEVDFRLDPYHLRIEKILNHLNLEPAIADDNLFKLPSVNSMNQKLPKHYICVALFAVWKERQYSIVSFIEILKEVERQFPIVLIGSPADRLIYEENEQLFRSVPHIDMIGRTDLIKAFHIISNSVLFIGGDTGLMHVAELFASNIVAIFGCCGPELRLQPSVKRWNKMRAFGNGKSCPLYPCFNGLERPDCKNPKRYDCLNISPTQIATACKEIFTHPDLDGKRI